MGRPVEQSHPLLLGLLLVTSCGVAACGSSAQTLADEASARLVSILAQ